MTETATAGAATAERPLTVRSFGGIHQLQVIDDLDLGRIDTVDPARWAATSAPIHDLHCDAAFLAYVDGEGTGRIRVSQLVAARDWIFERLANRKRMTQKADFLALADLDLQKEGGRRTRQAAEHVLLQLGVKERERITLAQVQAFRASYNKTLANGDGIVCPEVIPEPEVAQLIRDVMATTGHAMDASGRPGVGDAELARFLERARAYRAWKARPSSDGKALLPWGDDTGPAAALVEGLDAKIEELFWVCDLLKLEAQPADKLRLSPDDWKTFRARDAAEIERYLTGSPLGTPSPDGRLPLAGAVNPVYQERFEALRARVLERALGAKEKELTRALWRKVKALFAPYLAWQKEKPAEPFQKLPEALLEGYLSGPLAGRVQHFIGVDEAAAPELEQIAGVEKLILYQRWLIELVNNFVNFSAIYQPQEIALIEMGSLVIDGRRLDFTARVANRATHKPVASESLIFLVYAEIREKDGSAPAFEVVAPVTAGERGRIRTGKRGIFIDVGGKQWDAIVVDVVENPISFAEAIRAPFRRAVGFVSRKIEEFTSTQLQSAEKGIQEAATKAPAAPAAPPPLPGAAPAPAGSNLHGLVLVGGIAISAVTAALSVVASKLVEIGVTGVAGIVGAVIGLSAFLGWLRLRRRDMSLLLEANGWAVNVHMNVTRRLGGLFTRTPPFPKGTIKEWSEVLVPDDEESIARRKRRRRVVAATAIFLAVAAIAALLLFTPAGDVVLGWVEDAWAKVRR